MVYFITDKEFIKIGYTSKTPQHRLQQLQTSSPRKLYLIGYHEGEIEDEQLLHKRFERFRIRSNGEWFKPNAELIDYINTNSELEHTIVDVLDGEVMAFRSTR